MYTFMIRETSNTVFGYGLVEGNEVYGEHNDVHLNL